MVDIEPYEYQRKTNLKEHNDLVAKINEIVDVINNTNLDTILPKISKLETDVSTIEATDSLQWTDIENLKTKNTEYDTHFGLNDSQIEEITKSLVSDVALMNGTTTGNVKVRIGRKNAPSIDSDDYNIQKPTSVELIQGSAPAMVKAQITLSDGTVLISDDFMFTTEAIGTDVYISSFVFKNGNVAGSISADIGLSNGSTLTANNFIVPTDPNVTSAITDLQTRMTVVEGGSVGGLDELKATVDGHTASINALDSDVADLQIDKADVNNGSQSIVAGSISANNITKGGVAVATVNDIPVVPDISGKVDKAQGTANAGKVLGINASGNVEPVTVESGGEVWEEVDLSNFPTDWVIGDRFKVSFSIKFNSTSPYCSAGKGDDFDTSMFEYIITNMGWTTINTPLRLDGYERLLVLNNYNINNFNSTNENNACFTITGYLSNQYANSFVTKSNLSTYIKKMYRLKK